VPSYDTDIYEKDIETTILDTIARRLGPERFALWFGATPHVHLEDERLTFEVASPFIQRLLEDDYHRTIQEACAAALGRTNDVAFVSASASHPERPFRHTPMEGTSARSSPEENQLASQKGEGSLEVVGGSEILAFPPSRSERKISPKPPSTTTLRNETASLFSSFRNEMQGKTSPESVVSPRSESKTRKAIPASPASRRSPSPPPDRTRLEDAPVRRSSSNKTPKKQYASLDTFHEGLSNRLAVKAIELAIHFPGKFTPIYLHGPTSVGKTHLLEGMYATLRKRQGHGHPLYMTSEQFTAEFLQGLQQGAPSFRNKFRGLSALLIDDIQFFLGKSATQGELLRLIDLLLRENVQLVFTGNVPLKELKGLRPELIARMEAGMICGIKPPERSTLLAIFQRMSRERNAEIPDEVARFVVSRLNVHARQLSGALNRLMAASMVSGQKVTLESARETLDDMIRQNRRSIRLEDIDQTVRDRFELEPKKLQSKSRSRSISYPRMLAMWLARKYTRSPLTEIGQYFGNRSHSTVISAQKRVDQWIADNSRLNFLESDLSISEALENLEQELLAG
jgi:chromosomal replication initiator protein